MERETIYKKMVEKFGLYIQIVVAIEELSEFTKELTKIIRNGFQRRNQFIVETVDVIIVLRQVAYLFGIELKDNEEEYGDYNVNYLVNQSLKEISIVSKVLSFNLDHFNGSLCTGPTYDESKALELAMDNLLGYVKTFIDMFGLAKEIDARLKRKEDALKEKFNI